MRVRAKGDDLAALLPVELQQRRVRQGLVPPVGVALDAAAAFDQRPEYLPALVEVPVKGQLLAQILVDIPQRQVPQHAELAPPRQAQHVLQIAVYNAMIIRFVLFFNVVQVEMMEFFSSHVYRTDDKVQSGRFFEQFLCPVEAHGRFAQLRAQPDGQPPGVLLPRLRHLRQQTRPVEMLSGRVTAPQHRVHVVGDAYLVQPGAHRRLRQLVHRQRAVRRRGGMGVIIRQIHGSPAHFFLKKLLRFS